MFNLLSANAFNLNRSKILSFGKELTVRGECSIHIHQPFSRTFFVFFSKICKFECDTTFDWINRMCYIQMLLNVEKHGEQD